MGVFGESGLRVLEPRRFREQLELVADGGPSEFLSDRTGFGAELQTRQVSQHVRAGAVAA